MTGASQNGRVLPVVTAIVAGAGTLGWVTFLGGAILWISFGEANLPRAEAVAKIPTPVLIATGAEFLAFAAVAVIVILAFLYWIDRQLQLALRLGLTRDVRRERELEERLEERIREADEAAESRARLAPDESGRDDAEKRAETAEGRVTDATRAAIREGRPNRGRRLHTLAIAVPTAALAIAAALVVDLGYGAPPAWSVPVIVALAAFAGWLAATLYERAMWRGRPGGASFATVALLVLVAVPVVMAFATYARARHAPRVEPAALLLADGTPVAAFFLAETADKVFVGTFPETELVECEEGPGLCPDRRRRLRVAVPARLLSLPAANVRNLTVGPGLPLEAEDAEEHDPDAPEGVPRTAREWALVAAINLCTASKRAAADREEGDGSPTGGDAGGSRAGRDGDGSAAREETQDADDAVAASPSSSSPCPEEARDRLTKALARERSAIAS